MASYGDWQLARFGRLTPVQADEYRASLGRLPTWPSSVVRFGLEQRYAYLDSVCAAASGRAKPGSVFAEAARDVGFQFSVKFRLLTPDGAFSISSDTDGAKWVASGPVDWSEVLRLGNRHFDSILAIARKPTWSERRKGRACLEEGILKAGDRRVREGYASHRLG